MQFRYAFEEATEMARGDSNSLLEKFLPTYRLSVDMGNFFENTCTFIKTAV